MDGARTPEELETLLEDALLTGSRSALLALFEDAAILDLGNGRPALGAGEIAQCALETWSGSDIYVADPRHVMQARNVALLINAHGVNVAQRSNDGTWRFAIIHVRGTQGNG